jgi:hypothetical protein
MLGQPIVFTEPGNPNWWSDIVGVLPTPGQVGIFGIGFWSDDDTGGLDHAQAIALFGNPVAFVVETGLPQNISQYANTVAHPGFTATFQSDVPDGGLTVGLLGLAFAGMVGIRRMLRN